MATAVIEKQLNSQTEKVDFMHRGNIFIIGHDKFSLTTAYNKSIIGLVEFASGCGNKSPADRLS